MAATPETAAGGANPPPDGSPAPSPAPSSAAPELATEAAQQTSAEPATAPANCYDLLPYAVCQLVDEPTIDVGPLMDCLAGVSDADNGTLCATARALAITAANLVLTTVLACADNEEPTCRQARETGQYLLVALQAAVNACISEQAEVCRNAMDTARDALATAQQCAAGATEDNGTLCATARALAVAAANLVLTTVSACAAQQDPTCRSAVEAANNALAAVGSCTNPLIGVLSANVQGPRASTDLYAACVLARDTALAVSQAIVTLATQCAAGATADNGTLCATARALAVDIAVLALDTANSCVNGWNTTCNTAFTAVTMPPAQ